MTVQTNQKASQLGSKQPEVIDAPIDKYLECTILQFTYCRFSASSIYLFLNIQHNSVTQLHTSDKIKTLTH